MLGAQNREGYWWAELEADTTLESDYILYLHVLGTALFRKDAEAREIHPRTATSRRRLEHLLRRSFGAECHRESLRGIAPGRRFACSAAHGVRAGAKIHELGGLEATNSYVRFYLAMVGAIDWSYVPAIPPELMLLPEWFPVNLYEMSSWTRGIVIPMAIVSALKPELALARRHHVRRAFQRCPARSHPRSSGTSSVVSWKNFFLALDRALKLYDRLPWKPTRKTALARARQWMLERLERSEGLGTIYPGDDELDLCAAGVERGSRMIR